VLAGVAGLLLAWQIGVFSPEDYQPTLTFYAYLILILGGMNRLLAIPVGAGGLQLALFGDAPPQFLPAVADRFQARGRSCGCSW